jgi:hypothetical protein
MDLFSNRPDFVLRLVDICTEDNESVCCLHHGGLIINEHSECAAYDFVSVSKHRKTAC